MRFAKLVVISLAILFVLLTIIGLLMPSSVTVGRSVEIDAPVSSVRFYTNDLSRWRLWLNGADTAYYKQLTPGTSGESSQIKLGSYNITVIKNDPKYIITLWQGEHTREQVSRIELYYNSANSTAVNWSFEQQLKWYPWERLTAMLHDKIFGPSMEASLYKLKQVVEKRQITSQITE